MLIQTTFSSEGFRNLYVCIVSQIARLSINRVRLPVLHVVSRTGKMHISLPAYAIWSRETGSAVPSHVSLLISILRLNLVLTYGIPPEFCGGVHLFISRFLKENQNAPRPSEHPPVRGKKMSKRSSGAIIGCKHKTSS